MLAIIAQEVHLPLNLIQMILYKSSQEVYVQLAHIVLRHQQTH